MENSPLKDTPSFPQSQNSKPLPMSPNTLTYVSEPYSPNEGEGLRGEGGDACRNESQERLKKRSRCGKTSVRRGSMAIPLTPQPLSPVGRGEPQSNLISIFSQVPLLKRGISGEVQHGV